MFLGHFLLYASYLWICPWHLVQEGLNTVTQQKIKSQHKTKIYLTHNGIIHESHERKHFCSVLFKDFIRDRVRMNNGRERP